MLKIRTYRNPFVRLRPEMLGSGFRLMLLRVSERTCQGLRDGTGEGVGASWDVQTGSVSVEVAFA